MSRHISEQYDTELDSARSQLMEMGGLVEQLVKDACHALTHHDEATAQRVRDEDKKVNRLEVQLDDKCINMIARRQPAASDLRTLVSIMRASTDLERIGDEAGRIAKTAQAVAHNEVPPNRYLEIRELANAVEHNLAGALDAYARLDASSALRLIQEDDQVDEGYNSIVRTMVNEMREHPERVEQLLNVIWAARALERIGDHAKNICEYVVYLVRGKDVRHRNLGDVATG